MFTWKSVLVILFILGLIFIPVGMAGLVHGIAHGWITFWDKLNIK